MTEEEFTGRWTAPVPRPAGGRFAVTAIETLGPSAVRQRLCATPYCGSDPPAGPPAALNARPR
ncbi:hypothetical protein [Streptomyces violascens]|uniref:hypothetical protein n=1 Tax=Streptomyces violascens TaxID=67381 RepID=UPI001673D56F|nr:hypothetical protein [Streptomyces violascens]